MRTQMGRIASLLTQVGDKKSPLQLELDSLTKVLGIIAWSAVLVIVLIGFARGQSLDELLFLATAVAISAIPTGLPVFVQSLLAWGASKLAKERAIVASLTETVMAPLLCGAGAANQAASMGIMAVCLNAGAGQAQSRDW